MAFSNPGHFLWVFLLAVPWVLGVIELVRTQKELRTVTTRPYTTERAPAAT